MSETPYANEHLVSATPGEYSQPIANAGRGFAVTVVSGANPDTVVEVYAHDVNNTRVLLATITTNVSDPVESAHLDVIYRGIQLRAVSGQIKAVYVSTIGSTG